MPRLKAAGNTKRKKRCNPGRSFPCGYSCQAIGRNCRNKLKGQAATSQEWLKLQASRMEKISPYLESRKTRNERRDPDNNGGIDSIGDRPPSNTPAPRPPDRPAPAPKSPIGFRTNKYGGYTPDGRYIEAGDGLIRQEKGKWVTYAKDQVHEDGTIKNVKSKEEKAKRQGDRLTQATQAYRQKAGEGAHPDPIGAIKDAILRLDDADRDRGAEKNNIGWSGSTRDFGASLARQIKDGKPLTPKQLAAGLKLVGRHSKQVSNLPTQADLAELLSELEKLDFSVRRRYA